MDTLPVELITRISFLACVDGGFTACSLSVVCKFIRAASRPARFHTVAFVGASLSPLKMFLSLYREERTNDMDANPKVQHLFVSTFPLKGGELTPNMLSPEVYTSVVSTLLEMVAPTVKTLTCIGFRRSIPDLATLGIFFPVLEELTICDMPNPHPLNLHLRNVAQPCFPNLRRLHKWNRSIEPRWTVHAPSLTHVRISELLPIDFSLGPLPSGDSAYLCRALFLSRRLSI